MNVTSIATKEPIPGLMLSNSHRLAAVGAFKTLSRELARDGILLNSVAPGRIATDRIASMAGTSLEELRRRAAARHPRRAAGHAATSSATWSRSCARSARPTSTA